LFRKYQGVIFALYRINRDGKFANRLFAAVSLSKISKMPKKEKITIAVQKPKKKDKLLHDEIERIIEVTEEQNLAIRKILKNNGNNLKQKE
jgi:hypothetical protein